MAVLVWMGGAAAASAQTASPQVQPAFVRTVDFAVSAWFAGGVSYGSAAANLIKPDGSSLRLFTTSSRLGLGKGLEAHIGLRVRPGLDIEVTGGWRRATFSTDISDDFEGAPDTHVTTSMSQFSVEGSALFRLGRHGRLEPFVRVGFGWMRQITTDATLARDAGIANAGAGVKYWWHDSPQGAIKRLGLRLDARAVVRSGGIALSKRSVSVAPAFSAGLFIGF